MFGRYVRDLLVLNVVFLYFVFMNTEMPLTHMSMLMLINIPFYKISKTLKQDSYGRILVIFLISVIALSALIYLKVGVPTQFTILTLVSSSVNFCVGKTEVKDEYQAVAPIVFMISLVSAFMFKLSFIRAVIYYLVTISSYYFRREVNNGSSE